MPNETEVGAVGFQTMEKRGVFGNLQPYNEDPTRVVS